MKPTPLSTGQEKFYRKLLHKKYREAEGLFLAGGKRVNREFIAAGWQPRALLIRETANEHWHLPHATLYTVTERQLKTLSGVPTPQDVIGVYAIPTQETLPDSGFLLYLDRVADPGNLGTLIRTAAWFGLRGILLSPGSADPWQPKVVRASAGMMAHIPLFTGQTPATLTRMQNNGWYIWATHIQNGATLEQCAAGDKQILLMGSEAHGLSDELTALADRTLHIRRTGRGESLNLAAAAAIIMHHFSIKP
ncbi:MAG: RNA methyltransferase [Calditrichaeota bacterium]|nr:MAG: RNA methyltransferase [Calditrichota bacterium]